MIDVQKETELLYTQLKEYYDELEIDDHKELNMYFRVAKGYLEDLVALQERAVRVKEVDHFKRAVTKILYEIGEEKRIQFIERLREIAKNDYDQTDDIQPDSLE